MVGALVVYMPTTAALGALVPQPALLALAVAGLAACLTWYLTGRRHFRGARAEHQANREWAFRGPLGQAYFGSLMGAGVLTQMTTPLVYASIFVAWSQGLVWALVAAVGFGIGRSAPAIAGAALARRPYDPHSVFLRLAMPVRGARVVGAALASVCLLQVLL